MKILTESGWKEVSSDSEEQLDELTAPTKRIDEARRAKKLSTLPKIYGWRKKRNKNELEQINELTAPTSISKRGVRKVLTNLDKKRSRAAKAMNRANYPSDIKRHKAKANKLGQVLAYGTKYDGK